MLLWIFLALQLAATLAGFTLLSRRLGGMQSEIARLREALDAQEQVRALPRARRAESGGTVAARPGPALARAARVWRAPPNAPPNAPTGAPPRRRSALPAITSQAQRMMALAFAATAPFAAFLFTADASLVAALGLCVAGAILLVTLRPDWRAGAWGGVAAAVSWALFGFGFSFAAAAAAPYCAGLALAAACALIHTAIERTPHGPIVALAMGAASIALGAHAEMIAPAGAAFAAIVAASAIVGASSLRLEPLHFAAFAAALAGLFVLSGQESAAIWFTPAAALTGGLFAAIAAVRTPQLGARGAGIAGIGALAPLLAIASMHASNQGLADDRAAAGAYVALAALLASMIALTADRRARGLPALGLTLWMLAFGAFAALASAVFLVAAPPAAATAFAAIALGLAALDARAPDAAWRALACMSAAISGLAAIGAGLMAGNGAAHWPAWASLALGFGVPALTLAIAARITHEHAATPALLKTLLAALLAVGASLTVHALFSTAAPLGAPLSFVETGAHISAWLILALALGANARRGSVRLYAATALGFAGLAASAIAAMLWLTPYWSAPAPAFAPYQALGFLAPALLFWAHWVFWRARGAVLRTHLALAAAGAMSAAYATVQVLSLEAAPRWLAVLIGTVSFALAIALNFAPGVTAPRGRRSHFHKEFHGDRRRQQRR